MDFKTTMGVLLANGIQSVQHYTPLHYLPFIGRSCAILSKPSLYATGFKSTHLRSMSHGQDVARGFGEYAHLTLDHQPRILKAKLGAGFPHLALSVPSASIEALAYSLCRFNVAMTRYLRRGEKCGVPESDTNGRYYPGHQIPIARTTDDKMAMLKKHLPLGTMIEVLIHGDLVLPDDITVLCYSEEDLKIARTVLSQIERPWHAELSEPPGDYPRSKIHGKSVDDFIAKAIADPDWRGNGLEFDRLH
ncbi:MULTISPECIES: hypothetical protein [unclassified Bradyrhizobium]|uniref:hypothetical protein n=1 Tax=unclassified Bradyrhizobium TaxID=2631580 RepID=UPI001BABB1E5|nr:MULTISPECIES: hypothetical protein [unclassified Bradyrhizobium]MBR1204935.1 hypothetical protein [Bradyrhizobium sp. AUGA SZCCT0124]MBR1312021.1 hypothetical protein [Bradyrhizobium sp. AUGA SZCCT0051]MBR1343751.1 hypothetical protein [Bradyrhizobium sp. AUGA SZCCT0105]MBR1358292.1 hypothetical protein [Bradyrhizobium sp. AUGA SZCCT0045]